MKTTFESKFYLAMGVFGLGFPTFIGTDLPLPFRVIQLILGVVYLCCWANFRNPTFKVTGLIYDGSTGKFELIIK